MYQLQRGPLLGDVAGHADERALLYATFLAAAMPGVLQKAAPVLYTQAHPSGPFQQVPAMDLALQPGGSRGLLSPSPHCPWVPPAFAAARKLCSSWLLLQLCK